MVRFAPLVVPLERRLQTAAVLLWGSQLIVCVGIIAVFLLIPWLWPVAIAYIIWMLSDDAPVNGGRPQAWLRSNPVVARFAAYFPITLKKDYDLDPTKTYIFGYHPHGIIGIGAIGNFAVQTTGFPELFPGLDVRVCTLDSNFRVPVWRDFLLAAGLISVSKTSVSNYLNKGPGKAAVIVIGGAAEALYARPGTADLTLRERKGFVKLAIRQGASLVPVFSFGENDLFDSLVDTTKGEHSRLRTFQNRFKKLFGFSLPLFIGRGVFNYNLGLLPHRHAVVSVTGEPIPTAHLQTDEPSPSLVDKVHEKYMRSLEAVYARYKDEYARDRKTEMRFVH